MRRRHLENADQGIDLGVIITPMLDMAFQLLAFFIMTYQPPASEAAVDGTLLPATQASKSGALVRPVLHVIVKADKNGNSQPGEPTAIFLKKPGDADPRLIATVHTPADFAIALDVLGKELAGCRQRKDEKDLPLILEGDRSVGYGHLVAVQDVVRAAKFNSIEFQAASASRD